MGWTFTSFTFETQERPAAHRHTWPGCGERFSGRAVPAAGLSAAEKLAYEQLVLEYAKGIGYGYQMGLRPRAIYGIADSPVGIAAYFLDHDARQAPRSWAGHAYPKLIHYNKVEKGGHFAASEQLKLFSEEVRAGFRSLR
jgi:hypothetical protein